MFVKREEILDKEYAGEAPSKKGIEPPKETPVIYATDCLRWISLVLGSQDPSFLYRFEHQNHNLESDGSGEDNGNHFMVMIVIA
jgi:hypothetical protein